MCLKKHSCIPSYEISGISYLYTLPACNHSLGYFRHFVGMFLRPWNNPGKSPSPRITTFCAFVYLISPNFHCDFCERASQRDAEKNAPAVMAKLLCVSQILNAWNGRGGGGSWIWTVRNSVGRTNYGISRASAFFPARTHGSRTPDLVVPSD